MAQVEGIDRVRQALNKLSKKFSHEKRPSVTVGFTQRYAVHVHENTSARHNVGESKYLEKPARRLASELGNIVSKAVKNGATLDQGLLLAGLRLQREAQQLTPVDTGALKASAFTAFTKNEEQAAATAFRKSEAVRNRKKK